jgi:hypothetical protein
MGYQTEESLMDAQANHASGSRRLGAVDRISRHPIRPTILVAIAAALAIIALVLASSGNNSAVAATSLVNGNFETGDLTGWTVDTTSGGGASAVEPNAAGWNKANLTVSLNATDNQGGSGVQKITYAASGAQNIAQTDAPDDSVELTLDQEGTTTLTYCATDKAGKRRG